MRLAKSEWAILKSGMEGTLFLFLPRPFFQNERPNPSVQIGDKTYTHTDLIQCMTRIRWREDRESMDILLSLHTDVMVHLAWAAMDCNEHSMGAELVFEMADRWGDLQQWLTTKRLSLEEKQPLAVEEGGDQQKEYTGFPMLSQRHTWKAPWTGGD